MTENAAKTVVEMTQTESILGYGRMDFDAIRTDTYRLREEAHKAEDKARLGALHALVDAIHEAENVDAQLRAALRTAAERCQDALTHLDRYGDSGNSLGILQNTDVDRLCGEHARAMKAAVRIARIYMQLAA